MSKKPAKRQAAQTPSPAATKPAAARPMPAPEPPKKPVSAQKPQTPASVLRWQRTVRYGWDKGGAGGGRG